MRKATLRTGVVGLLAAGALVPLGAQALAQSGGNAFYAELSGANELDPETGDRGAGDGNGVGTAAVVIRGRQVCFGITVANLDKPEAAHIHRGRANQNGNVVVEL